MPSIVSQGRVSTFPAGSGLRFGQNWHSRTADKSPGTVLPAADS